MTYPHNSFNQLFNLLSLSAPSPGNGFAVCYQIVYIGLTFSKFSAFFCATEKQRYTWPQFTNSRAVGYVVDKMSVTLARVRQDKNCEQFFTLVYDVDSTPSSSTWFTTLLLVNGLRMLLGKKKLVKKREFYEKNNKKLPKFLAGEKTKKFEGKCTFANHQNSKCLQDVIGIVAVPRRQVPD